MRNVFVFDIETIPDVENGRKLFNLNNTLSDHDVAEILFAKRREASQGSDFLRHHLQKIIAISIAYRSRDQFNVWSIGQIDSDEKTLLERFFSGIEKYTPDLVSWNGAGFDLPVIHYRTLIHGISAPRYWEIGAVDSQFRYNNYLNRYHYRHLDLMDILSGYQARASAPLDEIAVMLGLPGKMGKSGAEVWPAYQAGELGAIRDYCETDVLNTYLVYLRFELMRGHLTPKDYAFEYELVKTTLKNKDLPHLTAFSEKMPAE